jgi:hypothetical protein
VFVYETYSEYNLLLVFTRLYPLFIFFVLIYKIPHWKKSTTEYKERDKEHEEETIMSALLRTATGIFSYFSTLHTLVARCVTTVSKARYVRDSLGNILNLIMT